jgi:hypothetical protein
LGLKLVPLGTWRFVPHAEVVADFLLICLGKDFHPQLQEQG